MFATTVYPLMPEVAVDPEREWDSSLDSELPPIDPFRFLDLPPELRLRVYQSLLKYPNTIDLDPTNVNTIAPHLKIFRVCKQMHEEAYRVFYGQNTFRLFATIMPFYGGKFHLLMRLKPHYRACITSLELRLGPGWTMPPRNWLVNSPRLGLKDCKELRTLKVFVELDPMGVEVFREWRLANDGFTIYCKSLLHKLLERVPTVEQIEFDGWKSVKKSGTLMTALLSEARASNKIIGFGPEKGWNHDEELEEDTGPTAAEIADAQLLMAGGLFAAHQLTTPPATLIHV